MQPIIHTREGRSALEDALGGWLNGNHQAELEVEKRRADVYQDQALRAEGALDQAIRYWARWHALDEGVERVIHDLDILMELSDLDTMGLNIVGTIRENLMIARQIAHQQDVVDLTTDEETEDSDGETEIIDLTEEFERGGTEMEIDI